MYCGNSVYVGLDLGQTRDHSAIAVVERDEQPLAWMPSVFLSMRVQYLQRLPLGTRCPNGSGQTEYEEQGAGFHAKLLARIKERNGLPMAQDVVRLYRLPGRIEECFVS